MAITPARVRIYKGSSVNLDIPIYESDGKTLVSNLASLTEAIYQIKINKADAAAVVEKLKSISGEILVDTPSTGYLRIVLTDEDTDIGLGYYYHGLRLRWGDNSVQEVRFKMSGAEAGIESQRLEIEEPVVIESEGGA